LREEAAGDGFEIEFVMLSRPDHFGFVDDDRFYRSSTIIVGTGHHDRTNFRAENETGLRRLNNYSDWRILPLTETAIQAFGIEGRLHWLRLKLEMMFPEDTVDLPPRKEYKLRKFALKFRLQKGVWRLGQVRECQHLTGPAEQRVRYVPTKFFGMEGEAEFLGTPRQENEISSTRIREILTHVGNREDMVEALSGVALCPSDLVTYVRRHMENAAQQAKQGQGRVVKRAKGMRILRRKHRMAMRASN
jgi:hypothetical protein